MKLSSLLFWTLFLLGITFRLYLAYSLPIWHDEAFSIWASQQPYLQILLGEVDPVHPPIYYLFLKLWSQISIHLFWLRISSILFFIANFLLLKKIGEKISTKTFSLILLFLYTFSGYFVIFDWQVRMYTSLVTFILLSLYLLSLSPKAKTLVFFTLINALGLYLDYGFIWYFLPLTTYLLIFKTKTHTQYLLSCFISGFIGLLWLPVFIKTYSLGINGIDWMSSYINPLFSVPYFLGTHNNHVLSFLFLIALIFCIIVSTQKNNLNQPFSILIFATLVSLLTSLLYSALFSPLFHLRSLQIVGLTLIFMYANLAQSIVKSSHLYTAVVILGVFFTNFLSTYIMFYKQPSRLLVSFFPWKKIKTTIDQRDYRLILYNQTKPLPSSKLIWGLRYTLNGKEALFSKPISHKSIKSESRNSYPHCQLIHNSLLNIYGCK